MSWNSFWGPYFAEIMYRPEEIAFRPKFSKVGYLLSKAGLDELVQGGINTGQGQL